MTNPPLKCIFFDVDGVLLDSLPQHLQICHDLARRYDLSIAIPTVSEMRTRIGAGLVVSPMRQFFLAVGFPPELADQADNEYERQFAERYQPQVFAGVPDMLLSLHQAGLPMGLVTANIRKNVEPALRESMDLFDPRCVFFWQPGMDNITKAAALARGAQHLGVSPANCIFVGDQPSDASAALAAGCRFLGVTYGWGISGEDGRFQVARSVTDIPAAINVAFGPLECTQWLTAKRTDPFMTTHAPITATERDSQALTHVRELHKFFAELRSKNFDFFLILLGAAAGAVIAHDAPIVRFCAAVAAAMICVVFFGLDTRTVEMIADARLELERLEPLFGVHIHRPDSWSERAKPPFLKRALRILTPTFKGHPRLSFISHKFLYRTVFTLGYCTALLYIWTHPFNELPSITK